MDSLFPSCAIVAAYMFFILIPSVATAEIYQCLDDNGRPSFSQTPCPVETVTGDSAAHKLWKDMRVLVNTGKNNAQKQGADVKSMIECKNREVEFAQALDVVDERLAELSSQEHKYLFSAQRSLRECGSCSSSAITYCQRADKALEKESAVLMPQLKASAS